jgi:hypothetical protein
MAGAIRMSLIETCVARVALVDLRPTQASVGFHEVGEKRKRIKSMTSAQLRDYVAARPARTVIGPDDRHYLIDHHHLSRALLEEGVRDTFVEPVAAFTAAGETEFWSRMAARGFVRAIDRFGRPMPYADIPTALAALGDDPYRSLASLARRAGAFLKDGTPYAEFAWADFFRERIDGRTLEAALDGELTPVLALAHAPVARHLPGYCGAAVPLLQRSTAAPDAREPASPR